MAMRILVPVLFATMLAAQPPQGGGGGMQEAPKNLKILKPEDVMTSMRSYTAGLGVRCDFCHVQGDFSSDTKPEKVTARMMITMTHDINANNFNGRERVSCYTCHHGASHPERAPAAGAPGGAPGAGPGR